MAIMIRILLVVFLAFMTVEAEEEAYCYSHDLQPYSLYSTKTSYFEVDNEDAAQIEYPGKNARD